MCQPGSYSISGLEPCTLCSVGTYQPLYNQTSCLKCPAGAGLNVTTDTAGAANCTGMSSFLREYFLRLNRLSKNVMFK